MKKTLIFLMLAVLLIGTVSAQLPTEVAGLLPKNARSMGMGGAFRVFSTGYDTFFGNPAGFASKKGSLTLADMAAWAYVKPTQENIDKVMALVDGTLSTSDMIAFANSLITQNGLGAGASFGFGWAGKGFGAGVTMVTDEVVTGNSLLGAKLSSQTQLNGIVGLGIPINLGFLRVQIGADARAFYLLKSSASGWTVGDIATAYLTNTNPDLMTSIQALSIYGGYGFAFDGGLTLSVGPLSLGAVVRDFGMGFKMDESKTIGDIMNAMMVPTEGTADYMLKPTVTVGAGLGFKLGGLLAPSLYAELDNPQAIVSGGFDKVWNNLHAGAELKLLNFISARAGLNKGYISLGAGIDLIIFELDAALFTEELGLSPGDFGRTGIVVQAAIRF